MLLFEDFAQLFGFVRIEMNFSEKLMVIECKLVTNDYFSVSGSLAGWSEALV